MKNFIQDLKNKKRDFIKIFKESPIMMVYIFLIESVLGMSVLIELYLVSDLIDSMVGARVLRIMTSDIQSFIWYQIIFLIIFLFFVVLSSRLIGISEKVGRIIRHFVLISSLFILTLASAPIFIFISACFAMIASRVKRIYIDAPISILIIAYALYKIYFIIQQSIFGSLSIGDSLLFGGALIILASYFALTPHHSFFKSNYESNS